MKVTALASYTKGMRLDLDVLQKPPSIDPPKSRYPLIYSLLMIKKKGMNKRVGVKLSFTRGFSTADITLGRARRMLPLGDLDAVKEGESPAASCSKYLFLKISYNDRVLKQTQPKHLLSCNW